MKFSVGSTRGVFQVGRPPIFGLRATAGFALLDNENFIRQKNMVSGQLAEIRLAIIQR
jgi:hypothetical protein